MPTARFFLLCFVLLAASMAAYAQPDNTRSTRRGGGGDKGESGTRRAVVIGINKYENVRDLDYAVADAEMVAAFLRSPAGGALPEENIRLLTDERATAGEIWSNHLVWLRDTSQPGDEVLIYFAGHGDVEAATGAQNGLLLAYDAPPAGNYNGTGGTISLYDLERYVEGLSTKGVRVILVTDACRAGKVVSTEGARLTSANLVQVWDNVLKIVSSDSGQLSEEKPELGHGVFTYYLIEGLLGAADTREPKGEVDSNELFLYLLQHVPEQTNGQTPQKIGAGSVRLGFVAPDLSRAALAQFVPAQASGVTTTSRSSAVQEVVARFEAAVAEKRLQPDEPESAWTIFQQLREMPQAGPVVPDARRTLEAGLEESAQQVIVAYLNSGDEQPPAADFRRAANALRLARRLAGEPDMTPAQQARLLFLDGYSLVRDGHYAEGLPLLERSATLEPKAAHVLNALGYTYYRVQQLDRAKATLEQAAALAPRWVAPVRFLGFLAQYEGDTNEAVRQYRAALERDSESAFLYADLAEVHYDADNTAEAHKMWDEALRRNPGLVIGTITSFLRDRGELAEAERYFAKADQLAPNSVFVATARGDYYNALGDFSAAEQAFLEAVRRDPNHGSAHNGLGIAYELSEKYQQAEVAYRRAADLEPGRRDVYRNLGDVYWKQNDPALYCDVERAYREAIRLDSLYAPPHLGLAHLFAAQNRFPEAERFFQRNARLDSTSFASLDALADFYYNRGRYQEAEATHLQNLQRFPDHPSALNEFGLFYELSEQYEQALTYYSQAYDLENHDAQLLSTIALNIGDVHLKAAQQVTGNPHRRETLLQEAERWYRHSLELNADNATPPERLEYVGALRAEFLEAANIEIEPHKEIGAVVFGAAGQDVFSVTRDFPAVALQFNLLNPENQAMQAFQGHAGPVRGLALSPDGSLLATGSDDGTARVWDTTSGEILLAFTSHADWVRAVAFTPDGQHVFSGGDDGNGRLWRVGDGEEARVFSGHTGFVLTVDIGAQYAVTAGRDSLAVVWNLDGTPQARLVHPQIVLGVALSPDESLVATASADSTARIWNTATGATIHALSGHTDWIRSVAFSPDGRLLATAGDDGTIRLWDVQTGEERNVLTGHTDWVYAVAFAPDGRSLVSASDDKSLILWDVETGEVLRVIQ